MTDTLEAPRTDAFVPSAKTDLELCACGSGLRAERCCRLDLARTERTSPDGPYADRVARMSRAYNDGEAELAESLALDILEEAPGQRDALGALYNVRKDQGELRAAEALVRRIAALYPNDPTSQLVAAQFFMSRGAYALAHPYARMLVRLAPHAVPAHVAMGRVFNATNHPKAAEHHFRRA